MNTHIQQTGSRHVLGSNPWKACCISIAGCFSRCHNIQARPTTTSYAQLLLLLLLLHWHCPIGVYLLLPPLLLHQLNPSFSPDRHVVDLCLNDIGAQHSLLHAIKVADIAEGQATILVPVSTQTAMQRQAFSRLHWATPTKGGLITQLVGQRTLSSHPHPQASHRAESVTTVGALCSEPMYKLAPCKPGKQSLMPACVPHPSNPPPKSTVCILPTPLTLTRLP